MIQQRLEKLGLGSLSTVLAMLLMATYARVWAAQGGGFSSPPGTLLIDFGALYYGRLPDEPWRVLTAVFLHGGFLHLAFNLVALIQVGPAIERIWGRFTMLFIFIAAGVIGMYGSAAMHSQVFTVGASGGICGLIGAAAGWGQRDPRGRELRDGMLKWLAYTIIFGFAVGADNWAHGFGALAGAAFGFAVSPATWKTTSLFPVRVLIAIVGVVGAVGAVALVMTRTASPVTEPLSKEQSIDRVCRIYKLGNPQAALLLMQQGLTMKNGDPITMKEVVGVCTLHD